jgi:hypothetical protein
MFCGRSSSRGFSGYEDGNLELVTDRKGAVRSNQRTMQVYNER